MKIVYFKFSNKITLLDAIYVMREAERSVCGVGLLISGYSICP